MLTSRRSFLRGAGAPLAAPAVIPIYARLMPVRSLPFSYRSPYEAAVIEAMTACRNEGMGGFLCSVDTWDQIRETIRPLVRETMERAPQIGRFA